MKLLAIVVFSALAGCASGGGWYRDNTTREQFARDRYECELEAMRASPGGPVVAQQPTQTVCRQVGAQIVCQQAPVSGLAAFGAQPLADYSAVHQRNALERSCLYARGYTIR